MTSLRANIPYMVISGTQDCEQPKSSVVQTVCFCGTANEKKAYLKRQEKEPQQTVFMAMLQTPLLSG